MAKQEKKSLFTTSDKDLVIALWASGHSLAAKPYKAGNICYFAFDADEIAEDLRKYREEGGIEVDLWRLWAAYYLFRSHIHNRERDMMTLITMMALGCEPTAVRVEVSGIVHLRFPESSEPVRTKFLNNHPLRVNTRDFFEAHQRLRDFAEAK